MSDWRDLPPGRQLDRAIAEKLGYHQSLAVENGNRHWSKTNDENKAHGFAIFSPDGRYVAGSHTWWSDPNYPPYDEMDEAEANALIDKDMTDVCWLNAMSYSDDLSDFDDVFLPAPSTDVNHALALPRDEHTVLEIRVYHDGSSGADLLGSEPRRGRWPGEGETLAEQICKAWLYWHEGA